MDLGLTLNDYKKLGAVNAHLYIDWLNKYMGQFNINTPNRLLAFFPNILQESGNFYYTEELSSGTQYDTRTDLGNTPQFDGDGALYKGKGLGQLTGKKNYQLFTDWCKNKLNININFVKQPEKLKEPQYAVLSAIFFWDSNNLQVYADKGDFQAVCAIWNTGRSTTKTTKINGWDDRVKRYVKVYDWIKGLINEYKQ
jgi:putative chitinase